MPKTNTHARPGAAPVPRPSWQQRWGYFYLPAQIGLIYLLPQEWSRERGPLRALTSFMVDLVPSIAPLSAITRFPGLAETYMALIWLLVPATLFAAISLLSWNPLQRSRSKAPIYLGSSRWLLVPAAMLLFGAMLGVPMIGFDVPPRALIGYGSSAMLLRHASESRFWFGFLVVLMCWLWTMGVLFAVLFIRNFGRLRKRR